jgi:hypothetical protein
VQSKNETKSRNSQILMFPGLRFAMGVIKIMENKGVLSEILNRCTDVDETCTSSIKVRLVQTVP